MIQEQTQEQLHSAIESLERSGRQNRIFIAFLLAVLALVAAVAIAEFRGEKQQPVTIVDENGQSVGRSSSSKARQVWSL